MNHPGGLPNIRGDFNHVLYRRRATYDFEAVYFEDCGESMNDHHKTEALEMHYDPRFDRSATIYCTCGERFRKDETALDHLREVDAVEDHRYDRERWDEYDPAAENTNTN